MGYMSGGKAIYEFGVGADGDASMRALLGGKGANLAEMAKIGLPVPPGFTISTEVCSEYYASGGKLPENVWQAVKGALGNVEKHQGKFFGDGKNPLLFSVRSGARESMPGMMDSILNLGLNDVTVVGQAEVSGNLRFSYDCYRRFIQMYGDVVMGVSASSDEDRDPFEEILSAAKMEANAASDQDLSAEELKEVIAGYKGLILEKTGREFPQDVFEQLRWAIGAVFESWHNERAVVYRRKYNIPIEWGTAVNVQSMVFGNVGDNCATGVAFTRDPATGENSFYGEYLINAQGEDVVAGIRTPQPIANLKNDMPAIYNQLIRVCRTLERHFHDMQDFEFTVENGKLYMLQTRTGKRTGLAAVRIAVEMVASGLIDKEMAVRRIPADSVSSLLVPVFDAAGKGNVKKIASGLPAGPGAASGNVYFSAKKAEKMHASGEKVILCRAETSPEDIRGMLAAEGIVTGHGGVSSHAALVARQMGKVCVCGAGGLVIDYCKKQVSSGGVTIKEGEPISIDGTTGEIFAGSVAAAPSEVIRVLSGEMAAEESYTFKIFAAIMAWADSYRKLGVYANADSPKQARAAAQFGAGGIGLCRTEHMFFEGERIDYMREMILADNASARSRALAKLKPLQREDFEGIFREMDGCPVTIRLLDPPLHEFLPHEQSAIEALAKKIGQDAATLKLRVESMAESNPMLGYRGCRLGISYPEITAMQVAAILEAAAIVRGEGVAVHPEIMVPLTTFAAEFKNQAQIIRLVADEVKQRLGCDLDYKIGTMIEVPRACLRAGEIAEDAEFFSFGTNDLTQTTLGMSRDDANGFLPQYLDREIIRHNPFATIDELGVGELIKIACERGRATRRNLKIGICGEHGGDPASIQICNKIGLSYVSCSPNRVPVAKLAAAQAALATG
ncbi:MAG: pyruvate, phosphate dikinase [Puniceicoccales bacterium]|jgi:pyruvate,orthophosphate dikinase|nr:pyruvate, phosphate dikinase [Puniceicoccales bacterium]